MVYSKRKKQACIHCMYHFLLADSVIDDHNQCGPPCMYIEKKKHNFFDCLHIPRATKYSISYRAWTDYRRTILTVQGNSSQPHNQLLYTRHPQSYVICLGSASEEINVYRKRSWTVVGFHSCSMHASVTSKRFFILKDTHLS